MALTQINPALFAGSSNTTAVIQSNGTTAITVDASQNVGIKTSSPNYPLEVNGSVSVNNLYKHSSYNASMAIGNRAAQPVTFITDDTERMRIQASGALSFANTTDTGAYNAVLGYRNNHFMGQRSNTMAAGTLTSTMLTLGFELNGAAIVRVVDCGTQVGNNYFTNVYEYFVTCYNGTVTATLKQSQIGSGIGSLITTSTSSSTFNVIQQGNASYATWHDTAVDVLGVAAGNGSHQTMTITMAANN